MYVQPELELREQLIDLVDATGRLGVLKVHLFKNDIQVTPQRVLTDYVEADFTGYAASDTITWNTPHIGEDGFAHAFGDTKQFLMTDTTTVNTVYGEYITNSAGTEYRGARRFDAPREMNQQFEAITIIPELQLKQD